MVDGGWRMVDGGKAYRHELLQLLPFHARREFALFRGVESVLVSMDRGNGEGTHPSMVVGESVSWAVTGVGRPS